MTRILAAASALILAVTACSLSTLEPDSVTTKEVVDLQRIGDTSVILTRPDSFITLVAHIPGDATTPSVAFTTSSGFFVLTGTKDATVRAELDSSDAGKRLAARIAIRKDTSAFAIVSATVAGYRDTVRIRFR